MRNGAPRLMNALDDPPTGCGPAEGHKVGLFVAHGGPALCPLALNTIGSAPHG